MDKRPDGKKKRDDAGELWMRTFQHALAICLLDAPEWRSQSRQVFTISSLEFEVETTYQFRISPEIVERAKKFMNQAPRTQGFSPQEIPVGAWRQLIPVARLPKYEAHTIEVRDSAGVLLPCLSRKAAAEHAAAFLSTHYLDAFQLDQVDPAISYYFLLLSLASPYEIRKSLNMMEDIGTWNTAGVRENDILLGLIQAVNPFVQRPSSAINFTANDRNRLQEYLARQQELAKHMSRQDRDLASEDSFLDPLTNPLLLIINHARLQFDRGAPFQDARQVFEHLLRIIDVVRPVFNPPRDEDPIGFLWLLKHSLEGWVVYVELPIAVDLPFSVSVSFIADQPKLTRENRKGLSRGVDWVLLEIPLGDCMQTYVEFVSPDPELVIGSESRRSRATPKVRALTDGEFTSLEQYFQGVSSSPARLRIQTTRQGTAHGEISPYPPRDPPVLQLALPLRAKRHIPWTYRAVALLSVVVALHAWSFAVNTGLAIAGTLDTGKEVPSAANLEPLLVVAIGAMAIIILFASVRHSHPIVHQQVWKESALIVGANLASGLALAGAYLIVYFTGIG